MHDFIRFTRYCNLVCTQNVEQDEPFGPLLVIDLGFGPGLAAGFAAGATGDLAANRWTIFSIMAHSV